MFLNLAGVRKKLHKPKIIPFWSVLSLDLNWGYVKGFILIWGYTKGFNFDLGVRKGDQFGFGGMQRGSLFIWGYWSTKRLRTTCLEPRAVFINLFHNEESFS